MYPVRVSAKTEFTRRQKKSLKRFGLEYDGLDYVGYIERKGRVTKIRNYCDQHHLKFKLNNSLGNRSSDYRRVFFIYHKPQVMGKYYICAYCGKWMIKDKMTVDHLYPIGKSSKSIKYQEKLERRGLKNINDPRNLVAACKSCNQHKSARTGLWIFKGKIGRYKYIWYFRYLIRILILAMIIYLLFFKLRIQTNYNEILSQFLKYLER